MPVLLAGGLGGTLETGRVLDYTDKGDDNRKLCSMYLSLMDRMGVKLDCFGDADACLAGIWAEACKRHGYETRKRVFRRSAAVAKPSRSTSEHSEWRLD